MKLSEGRKRGRDGVSKARKKKVRRARVLPWQSEASEE